HRAGLGRDMFQRTSDGSGLSAQQIVARDLKEYDLGGGRTMSIAQIETVGNALVGRKDELLAALRAQRDEHDYALSALMVTDILARGTNLLAAGETGAAGRPLGAH